MSVSILDILNIITIGGILRGSLMLNIGFLLPFVDRVQKVDQVHIVATVEWDGEKSAMFSSS